MDPPTILATVQRLADDTKAGAATQQEKAAKLSRALASISVRRGAIQKLSDLDWETAKAILQRAIQEVSQLAANPALFHPSVLPSEHFIAEAGTSMSLEQGHNKRRLGQEQASRPIHQIKRRRLTEGTPYAPSPEGAMTASAASAARDSQASDRTMAALRTSASNFRAHSRFVEIINAVPMLSSPEAQLDVLTVLQRRLDNPPLTITNNWSADQLDEARDDVEDSIQALSGAATAADVQQARPSHPVPHIGPSSAQADTGRLEAMPSNTGSLSTVLNPWEANISSASTTQPQRAPGRTRSGETIQDLQRLIRHNRTSAGPLIGIVGQVFSDGATFSPEEQAAVLADVSNALQSRGANWPGFQRQMLRTQLATHNIGLPGHLQLNLGFLGD